MCAWKVVLPRIAFYMNFHFFLAFRTKRKKYSQQKADLVKVFDLMAVEFGLGHNLYHTMSQTRTPLPLVDGVLKQGR